MSTYAALAITLINALASLIVWWQRQGWMKEGEDAAIAAALQKVAANVKRADEAGAALDRTLSNPGRLRDHDPDERP
jgi:hypothetical protein